MLLMEIIKRKLRERDMAIRTPAPDDKIVNPLACVDGYKTVAEKRAKYNSAVDNKVCAVSVSGENIRLGTMGAKFNDVEFIGGLWRVQQPFDSEITHVRDCDFVLGEKLPHQEHTKFDFFRAYRVGINCYGRYVSENRNGYDYIVAEYKTSRGTYRSYGKTIADARAFLAISIYDAYQDLIDAENVRAK